MIPSRRNSLTGQCPNKSTNASLWLDKYLDRMESEPNQVLVDQVVKYFQNVPGYQEYFNLWKTTLMTAGVKIFKEALTLNRLAIDLGANSVLETNIALLHTYGVPYIPGSALKGLAAHFADQYLSDPLWRKQGGLAYEIVFGTTNSAGYVTFFDALYIPNSGKDGQAIWKDVITVHHADYYQSGSKPPADYDGTTIIPLLTASSRFLIGLAGPDEWVEKAYQILGLALKEEGIGAKTSSGYGRMHLEDFSSIVSKGDIDNYEIEKRRLMDETPPAGKIRGIVKTVKNNGQYAFVNPQGGGKEHFVHSTAMIDGFPLKEGQVLEYEVIKTPKGMQGKDVKVLLVK